jgi:hypothetical protein
MRGTREFVRALRQPRSAVLGALNEGKNHLVVHLPYHLLGLAVLIEDLQEVLVDVLVVLEALLDFVHVVYRLVKFHGLLAVHLRRGLAPLHCLLPLEVLLADLVPLDDGRFAVRGFDRMMC